MRNQIACGFLIVLAACNGTRTGNPFDDDPGEVGNTDNFGGGRCDAKTSALDSLSADTALGFSAEDVLAFAEGEHATQIRWRATATPETGEHDLVVRITHISDTAEVVTYTEAKPSGNTAGPTIDIGMPEQDCASFNAIEIAVDVELRSDEGALDEHVTGTLRARSTDLATLELSIDADELNGTLELVRPTQNGIVYTAQTYNVGLSISPLGVSGNVSDTFTAGRPGASANDTAAGQGGSFASIGAAGCDDGGFATDLDHKLQLFAAKDALDRVNDVQTLQATWRDGTSTTLDMELVHDGQAVCAILEGDGSTPGEDTSLLRLYGTLNVRSADDRLDAHWPVVLQARPGADGELGDIDVTLDRAKLPAAPIDDLEGVYGIRGIDVSAFDDANVRFELQVVGGTGEFAATLIVSGVTQPMCPPPPDDPSMGAPGCRGSDFTELESATISAATTD